MPRVSDREWKRLADDLARRVKAVAPDWTDHHDRDPGITIAELAAWLAESLIARPPTSGRALARLRRAVVELERSDGTQHDTERRTNLMGGDTRDQALQSLGETLRGSLTTEGLREWAHTDEGVRPELLEGRIFGTIRWPTSVGRPLGPTLASGFRVAHRYQELNWKLGPGGQPIDISEWRDGSPPSVWDRPGDDDHYEVGFACWGVRPWKNSVRVELVDGEPWDTRLQLELSTTFRVVVPEVQVIVLAGSSFAVLDPVTVEERPIRRFG